jgi:hypothetical protein
MGLLGPVAESAPHFAVIASAEAFDCCLHDQGKAFLMLACLPTAPSTPTRLLAKDEAVIDRKAVCWSDRLQNDYTSAHGRSYRI